MRQIPTCCPSSEPSPSRLRRMSPTDTCTTPNFSTIALLSEPFPHPGPPMMTSLRGGPGSSWTSAFVPCASGRERSISGGFQQSTPALPFSPSPDLLAPVCSSCSKLFATCWAPASASQPGHWPCSQESDRLLPISLSARHHTPQHSQSLAPSRCLGMSPQTGSLLTELGIFLGGIFGERREAAVWFFEAGRKGASKVSSRSFGRAKSFQRYNLCRGRGASRSRLRSEQVCAVQDSSYQENLCAESEDKGGENGASHGKSGFRGEGAPDKLIGHECFR